MEIDGVKKVDPLRKNWEKNLSGKARSALESLRKRGEITSSTGEITLNRNEKSMRIVTPRSEVLTGSGRLTGSVIVSAKLNGFQTIALMSLDGKKLTESRKILLVQLSDLSNNGVRFEDQSRRVLLSWGSLPQMLERKSAEMVLALPQNMRIVPLELDGTPAEREIPAEYRDGKLHFRAATDFLPGGTLSCLLTRE